MKFILVYKLFGSVLKEKSISSDSYLYKNCKAIIKIKVRSEGRGGRSETIVTHGSHHPVEKHDRGSIHRILLSYHGQTIYWDVTL